VTLEELRALRAANPEAYKSNIKRVVVDNDKPSSSGVWQGGGSGRVEFAITGPVSTESDG
jgi:hypothetical protein